MMRRPDAAGLTDILRRAGNDTFSYPDVGSTLTGPPAGYTVDHNRMLLGSGPEAFERARTAIRGWQMFRLGWVEPYPGDTPIEKGHDVAVLVHHFGFWSANVSRIVYTIDEPARFGFAYGTLSNHAESGEERFTVEYDPPAGDVWYDLYAFSRPNHPFAWLGYPIARRYQRRFANDSKSAMARAVRT